MSSFSWQTGVMTLSLPFVANKQTNKQTKEKHQHHPTCLNTGYSNDHISKILSLKPVYWTEPPAKESNAR